MVQYRVSLFLFTVAFAFLFLVSSASAMNAHTYGMNTGGIHLRSSVFNGHTKKPLNRFHDNKNDKNNNNNNKNNSKDKNSDDNNDDIPAISGPLEVLRSRISAVTKDVFHNKKKDPKGGEWRVEAISEVSAIIEKFEAVMDSLKGNCKALIPAGAAACPDYPKLPKSKQKMAEEYFSRPERHIFYESEICCQSGECAPSSCMDYESVITCETREVGAWDPGAFFCRDTLYPSDCCAGVPESEAAAADKKAHDSYDATTEYIHSRNYWGTVDLGRNRNLTHPRECTPFLITLPPMASLNVVRDFSRKLVAETAPKAFAGSGATMGVAGPMLNMDKYQLIEAEVKTGCTVKDYAKCEKAFRGAGRALLQEMRLSVDKMFAGKEAAPRIPDHSLVLGEEIAEDGTTDPNDIVFNRHHPSKPSPMRNHELSDGRRTCTTTLGAEAANLVVPVDTYESEVSIAPNVAIADLGINEWIVERDVESGRLMLNDSFYLVGIEQLDKAVTIPGTSDKTMFRVDDPRDCDVLFELNHADSPDHRPVDWLHGPLGDDYVADDMGNDGDEKIKVKRKQSNAPVPVDANDRSAAAEEINNTMKNDNGDDDVNAVPKYANDDTGFTPLAEEGVSTESVHNNEDQSNDNNSSNNNNKNENSKSESAPGNNNLLSPVDYAKRVVGTPYRGVHGTFVRSIAVPPSPGIVRSLRDAFAKFGRSASGPTILDANVAGPQATYSYGRTGKEVWETKDGMVSNYKVMSSPLARALFMLRSCNRATRPTVLSNSWGIDLGIDHSAALEQLKTDLLPREAALDDYFEDVLRSIALNGRGGLGCPAIFASPNNGRRQVMSSDNRLLWSPYVVVAVGYRPKPDGSRWCYVGDDSIPNDVTTPGRGVLSLPSYGPNVAISAPVGFCTADFDSPDGSGVRLTEANGNSAATPLVAAAMARVSSLLHDLPWNAVVDIILSTADTSRFVLPAVHGAGLDPGAVPPEPSPYAVMFPKPIMGCACRTRSVSWWECNPQTRLCPRGTMRHSVFNGFGAVNVPAAMDAAKRVSKLMRADARIARMIRHFYLRRSETRIGMTRSSDEIDMAACSSQVPGLSPAGHNEAIAYVADVDDEILLEHVVVHGTQMAVTNVAGVSMWLERVAENGATIVGTESIMQSPDVKKRKDTNGAGIVFGKASTMKHWSELARGRWRVCVTGLAAIDLELLEKRDADRDNRGERKVELALHGKRFRSFTLDPNDDDGSPDCTCAPPKRKIRDLDSVNVVPTDADSRAAKDADEIRAPNFAPTNARPGGVPLRDVTLMPTRASASNSNQQHQQQQGMTEQDNIAGSDEKRPPN